MKINQVEELVGITKKNIRFYEEQGLICPERNRDNGYREYSLKDVDLLNKIKLLRSLDVPIDEIRKLEAGEISMVDCLEKHISHFTHRQKELDIMKEMCREIMEENVQFDDLQADSYLENMRNLERGGVRFMDVNKTDIKKTKRGPIIAAGVSIIFFILMIVFMCWTKSADEETPIGLVVVMVLLFVSMIVGVLLALRQRLKEIDGGEINEARKY
ncbi:MAG: MerR family transcriptional regulator [Pseudobutyrivibrio sp.]|uniref:MerR family transcriptional regulator n=1 Tax=Pseudobutyrivibrio sp. TaxID=2014367 RepID=UPI001B4A817C|nr:MerR family transcriptional regulator [Pseudobutyrivibrio sp.]MBP5326126.1 MerR family transcriptional regulator [Pseudobutyrivibrio sp.]MBR5649491.1 MerR family transcriptional regulator [Pseudobutyrivibrio sp.]